MLTGATTFASFKQYLSEGPRHFLRGVVPALCIKGISGANLYGSNDVVKLRVKDLKFSETTNQVLGSVLAGTYSGSTDCLLFGPFERIQTLLLVSSWLTYWYPYASCRKQENSTNVPKITICRTSGEMRIETSARPIPRPDTSSNTMELLSSTGVARSWWPGTWPRESSTST